MPAYVQRQKAGIAFVHVSDPSGQVTCDPKVRRLIRSHVSRVQHSRRFQSDGGKPLNIVELPNGIADEDENAAQECDTVSQEHRRRQQSILSATHRTLDEDYNHVSRQYRSMTATFAVQKPETSHYGTYVVNDQIYASPLQQNPQDSTDELQKFLNPFQLSISECLDRYNIGLSKLVADNQANSPVPGVSREMLRGYMNSLIMDGAAYRAVAILGSIATLRTQTAQSLDHPAFLRLYGHVLKRINDALRCSATAEQDDTVQSILGIMCIEAFYGSRERYRVHLQGLAAITTPKRPRNPAFVTIMEWTKTNSADPTRFDGF